MISGNQSTEFGDVLIIRANVPIIGLIALTDYLDDTTEQGNNRFYKEFRYTIDGINYTTWQELTADNLNAVVIDSRDTFIVEYRYTHINDESASFSISGSLDLAWNSTQLDGQFLEVPCGKTYEQSIFADFFSCHATEVLAWCVNVTEKLYKQGIVPKFVTRGDESNINGIDRDYIDFWRAVACFFAYIVVFARQFEKFRENDQLLSQFLEQRGVFFCDDASSADKNYLVEYYFDEIRQRGTSQIYKTKDQRNSEVDGELLRLLCYNKEVDEFIFNVHLPHTIGWSVENSSPLYTGLSRQTGAIKGYEFTKDFIDLGKYPIFGNGVIEIIEDNGDQVLSIKDVPIGEISGIGENNLNYKIVVDDDMSYEITFFVRQVDAGENLTFGVRTYDIASNSISPVRIDTDTNETYFFEKIQLNKTDKYYLVRGIIYSKDTNASDVENNLSIGQGKHLKFASGTYGLIPYIAVDKDDDQSISLSQFVGWNQLNSNIITDGDNGTFEDIEANWGNWNDIGLISFSIERSSNFKYQGNYSCRVFNISGGFSGGGISDWSRLLCRSFSLNLISGRRYIVRAKLYTDGDTWPNRGSSSMFFNFVLPITNPGGTMVSKSNFDINGQWQEISYDFIASSTEVRSVGIYAFWNGVSTNLAHNGEIYIDQLQCAEFEFIGDESETISTGNEVRIWDLKVRPLNTPYSTGFMLPKNFISIWAKKRNGQLSERQLEQRLRKYLLPYNSTFKVNYLEVESGDALGDYSANDYSDDYFI